MNYNKWMVFAFLFFTELLVLFMLSKHVTNLLFSFFYRSTRSKHISVYLMSLIFLPGTLIHEVSHAAMAIVLGVPVGKMELIPKLADSNLKLGSVEIGKTDPIRRMLIGMAPFIFGSSLLVGLFYFSIQAELFRYQLSIIIIMYLVFEIGNTMFSSKKDMEGALEVILALTIIVAVCYLIGIRLPVLSPSLLFSNPLVRETFQKASLYLAAPISIDLVLIGLLRVIRH